MCNNGVAFFLVVVEEEPKGAVVVVGSGDVAHVTAALGIVHNTVAKFFLLLQIA